ncbi:hypothetical protein WJX75_004354 [Coccomyxa subellipsoidea]|uniref:peptidylprolyl isomerase n=1 Tax=Coccomyxa subellipsoidea TaxID=248742 RepID=A0ABR2Z3G1_9CHLO
MPSSAGVAIIVSLFAAAFAKKTWKDVDTLQVGVKGWLTDGTEFGSSIGAEPLKFQLGEGDVIEGWEQGLLNMCVDEKRRLKIPAALGYRDIGYKDLGIPAGASLYFDTELVSVEEGPEVLHINQDSLVDLSEF